MERRGRMRRHHPYGMLSAGGMKTATTDDAMINSLDQAERLLPSLSDIIAHQFDSPFSCW